MRVRVFETDKKTLIGLGEMHREDLDIVSDNDHKNVICTLRDHPHIDLDDGRVMFGCECWWEPL